MNDPAAGRAVRGLFAAAQTDLAVRSAFGYRYVQPRRGIGGRALTRAQLAGQLRPDVDVQVLIDQLWGAYYFRWSRKPPDAGHGDGGARPRPPEIRAQLNPCGGYRWWYSAVEQDLLTG